MTVTPKYAEAHLEELLAATETGQEVDIVRPDKPPVRLTPISEPARVDRSAMFGAGKGAVRLSEDWDSPETNEEIARLFHDGPIFPEQ